MRDDDIRHIHPVHFEHINPFGHYRFDTRRGPAKGRLRPLRPGTYTSRAIPATDMESRFSTWGWSSWRVRADAGVLCGRLGGWRSGRAVRDARSD
jgi:hypothetical protein